MKGLDLIDVPSFGHHDVLSRKQIDGISEKGWVLEHLRERSNRIGLWDNVPVDLPGSHRYWCWIKNAILILPCRPFLPFVAPISYLPFPVLWRTSTKTQIDYKTPALFASLFSPEMLTDPHLKVTHSPTPPSCQLLSYIPSNAFDTPTNPQSSPNHPPQSNQYKLSSSFFSPHQ